MRIKKFYATNIAEALKDVREEFGENALILSTNKAGSKKGKIEVVAAIDDAVERKQTKERVKSRVESRKQAAAAPRRKNFASKVYSDADADVPETDNNSEISDLRSEISRLNTRFEGRAQAFSRPVEHAPENLFLQKLRTFMLVAGVHRDIVNKLVGELSLSVPQRAFKSVKSASKILQQHLGQFIRTVEPVDVKTKAPYIISIVGPTGVGKTTTLAKIASHYKIDKKLEVGLISIDTFRLAAIEQLRTFAHIAKIPLRVAYEPRELVETLQSFSSFDVIIIDTVGTSPRNFDYLRDLQSFIEIAKPHETHLALSATTRFAEMEEIVKQYQRIAFNRVLLTKIDEIIHPVILLNISKLTPAPLLYVTNGQNIPQDIVHSGSNMLTRLIVDDWDLAAWIN